MEEAMEGHTQYFIRTLEGHANAGEQKWSPQSIKLEAWSGGMITAGFRSKVLTTIP